MADRPTHEITTTSGHKVVLYDYITGRELRAIQEIMFGDAKIADISAGAAGSKNVAAAQDLSFKLLIVSIDGSSENIVERVLDLPYADFDDIEQELNAISDSKKKSANVLPTTSAVSSGSTWSPPLSASECTGTTPPTNRSQHGS